MARIYVKTLNYKPKIGFKMSLKNIGVNNINETISVSLPLYLSKNIKKIYWRIIIIIIHLYN